MHEIEVKLYVNIDNEQIERHIRHALSLGLPEFKICDTAKSVAIVAGGPSLADTWREIAQRPILACNGAARFLADRGVMPDYALLAEGGTEILELLSDPVPTKWLAASQCSPEVFEALKERDVMLWHIDNGGGNEIRILDELRPGNWLAVGGGSTVGLRAVNLAYLMGAREFHLYGFDSCFVDNAHHAYVQPKTDDDTDERLPVFVNGRKFSCNGWMISQAQEFQRVVKMFEGCQFHVHGDGLISWIHKIMSIQQKGN